MRRNMTPSERLLWCELRGSALNGLHFRRQQIVAGFILDFYCVEESLAVEVDGPVHDMQAESDSERDRALAALGIQTLRFKNEDVANDIDLVLKKIVDKCTVADLTP
jgi:very-short-patch-repair endonuclease